MCRVRANTVAGPNVFRVDRGTAALEENIEKCEQENSSKSWLASR